MGCGILEAEGRKGGTLEEIRSHLDISGHTSRSPSRFTDPGYLNTSPAAWGMRAWVKCTWSQPKRLLTRVWTTQCKPGAPDSWNERIQSELRPQQTYQTVGMRCACLAQHRIAVLRKKLWDFGYSSWKMNWNVLICYGSCIIGRDDFRIVSDSMEGIKGESFAGNSSFIHLTNCILWSGAGLTFNKKENKYPSVFTTL